MLITLLQFLAFSSISLICHTPLLLLYYPYRLLRRPETSATFIIILCRLRLAFSLHVFLQEHVLAVEHGIGELRYPVAENHETCLLRKE